ncbi:MAG: RNA polymerase sigma factor [Ignavibacteriales bacterium]|nr:RNA polymerase sigma factor [Ignavibacteriales bacterium]
MSKGKKHTGSMVPSDEDLILKAKHGNMTAFEQLVQRYDKRVLTIAASYVQSSDDAKDIYQEVFIRVYRGLGKFEHRSEFSTWLYRITTNVCLSHRLRHKRHPHSSFNQEHEEDDGVTHAKSDSLQGEGSTDQRAMSSEISDHVSVAMESLSPQQRLVFSLRHYEGYKLKEIATMMKCSEGTVKKYLFTATHRMRKKLKNLLN